MSFKYQMDTNFGNGKMANTKTKVAWKGKTKDQIENITERI